MNIQPIVEGAGDVAAVPVLLRRLRDEAALYQVDVNRPIRRKRHELVQDAAVRRAVQLAMLQPNCDSILILFDSDDDCPKELAPMIQAWAQSESRDIPCAVVMACREYEAWFLASIESLRGQRGIRNDAESHPQPEHPRGAKEQIESRMDRGRSYYETADQPALTALFDMVPAYRKCRSFRHIVSSFGQLITAGGTALENWPPTAWEEGA
jgi:hypothetical protein